jgi:hypothetical protein
MSDDLIRLVYVSQASHALSDAELVELLEQSRRNNLRDDITGALAYHNQSFLQVLEGSEPLVETLFGRITRDQRNYNLMTIFRSTVSEREFEDWSMGWVPVGEIKHPGFDASILFSRKASRETLDGIFQAFRAVGRPD